MILTVYHGRGSYELGIEFEKLDSPRERFNLYEMLQWAKEVGKLEEIPTAGYQVNSREAVYRGVTRLAELVSKYGGPLLEGDADSYQALQVQQASDSADYTREVHLRALRRQAEAAWQAKDYQALVSLYKEVGGDLSPSELRKFQYAEKQLLLANTVPRS